MQTAKTNSRVHWSTRASGRGVVMDVEDDVETEVEGDAPPAVERENSLGEKIGNA